MNATSFVSIGITRNLPALQRVYVNIVFGKKKKKIKAKVHVIMSHMGRSDGPFTRIQADFIEMPSCNGLKYILVLVCLFSSWVEAYPTRRSDSMTVAKLLLRELVPKFGLPVSIETYRGTH